MVAASAIDRLATESQQPSRINSGSPPLRLGPAYVPSPLNSLDLIAACLGARAPELPAIGLDILRAVAEVEEARIFAQPNLPYALANFHGRRFAAGDMLWGILAARALLKNVHAVSTNPIETLYAQGIGTAMTILAAGPDNLPSQIDLLNGTQMFSTYEAWDRQDAELRGARLDERLNCLERLAVRQFASAPSAIELLPCGNPPSHNALRHLVQSLSTEQLHHMLKQFTAQKQLTETQYRLWEVGRDDVCRREMCAATDSGRNAGSRSLAHIRCVIESVYCR